MIDSLYFFIAVSSQCIGESDSTSNGSHGKKLIEPWALIYLLLEASLNIVNNLEL